MSIHATEWLLVAAPVSGLILNVAVHVFLSWWGGLGRHLGPVIIGFFIGLTGQTVMTLMALPHTVSDPVNGVGLMLMNLGCYGGLGYGYFTFVNLTATSLRIRLIRELRLSGFSGASIAVLRQQYSGGHVVATRAERLQAWGQISQRDQRYHLKGKPVFYYLALFIAAYKAFLLGKR